MYFFTAGSLERDTENSAPGNFFGPSYFETALILISKKNITYGAPGPTLNPLDFGFCPSLALAPLIVGLV